MRIGVAVKNGMNFCNRWFQVMKSSVLTFLPYPRDILGRLPEGKTDGVLWNDLSLKVLQGNDHSSMGQLKWSIPKSVDGQNVCVSTQMCPSALVSTCSGKLPAQYCGTLTSFILFWAHFIEFVLPWMNDWLKGCFIEHLLEVPVACKTAAGDCVWWLPRNKCLFTVWLLQRCVNVEW